MPTFRINFKVRGTGAFPMDMLRYDHCYPVRPHDVDSVSLTRDNTGDGVEYREPRTIELSTQMTTTKSNVERCVREGLTPTKGRWASFGWKVLDNTISITKMENL